jgi:hypothetical protein
MNEIYVFVKILSEGRLKEGKVRYLEVREASSSHLKRKKLNYREIRVMLCHILLDIEFLPS